MIWKNGAEGILMSEEALSCIAQQTEALAVLSDAGQPETLPGIEAGTEKELGVRLIQWAAGSSNPLPEEACLQLEQGTAVLYGLSRYALKRVERLLKHADMALAMNLEAVRGELGAFDDRLHSLGRPFPGQIACAANVRQLVKGSELTSDKGRFSFGYDKAPRVQDAICLRAAPQTHGGVRDVFTFAAGQVERDIADHSETMDRAELALTGLLTALADLAHISERRTFRLNDTHFFYGLPMNLVMGDVGINHGFPVVQSTQAALVAELKLLTVPSQLLRVGEESMTYFTLCKVLKAVDLTERVLAVEILMSAQGMDIVVRKVPELAFGAGTGAIHRCLRQRVAVLEENRFMAPDMAAALELLSQGNMLAAAESAVGALQ